MEHRETNKKNCAHVKVPKDCRYSCCAQHHFYGIDSMGEVATRSCFQCNNSYNSSSTGRQKHKLIFFCSTIVMISKQQKFPRLDSASL